MEIANIEQAEAWDGDEGRHWAEHQDRYDASIGEHHRRLLATAAIGLSEQVLDIGCGNGQTTRDAARAASSGAALGLDLSAPMLERARLRAEEEGVGNVRFERGDAQVHPFEPASADVAISRFGVMFFADPVAAFTNVGRAVRPGGRLAFLVWQTVARNDWILALRAALAAGRTLPEPPPGAPGPFGLADRDHIRRVLFEAGFRDVGLEAVEAPFRIGADGDDAYTFVSGLGVTRALLADLDEPTRQEALDALRATLTDHETADGVVFGSAVWLVTARRP